MKKIIISLFLLSCVIMSVQAQETITFSTLLDEMTDLERLTQIPDPSYRVIQFSSYDRRSRVPGNAGWFANSDGFGEEPIPGFEGIISEPDEGSTGTYLVCDVQGPGAIQRLWTAGINGEIRCFLDDMKNPVFEGKASGFFWETATSFPGNTRDTLLNEIFRQFDATYFPIPFSGRCRIEWTGDISKIHFYHIGIRLYEQGTQVRTFSPEDISGLTEKTGELKRLFQKHEISRQDQKFADAEIQSGKRIELLKLTGPASIGQLSMRLGAEDAEQALRQCILNIWFDESEVPQVHAPLGDFFGAAPGLNPYQSYPFSVGEDSLMICRFPMPFRDSVRISVENLSDISVRLQGWVRPVEYDWKEGRSMHFRARWRIDHDLTASNIKVRDIPYQIILGKGRLVGAAAYLYNPGGAVTSWGNWWGEGDEKIFFDGEKFPSFFGTGSEDYFNYSWSSERIFSYPYCGQPRNDGPGNRGHVANYRWHISDDLYFRESLAFYMELLHHGEVPGFSYGRIVYAYVLPGCRDDYIPVTAREVEGILYDFWVPQAYLGSAGFVFFQAEDLLEGNQEVTFQDHDRWSDGKILYWKPEGNRDKLQFNLDIPEEGEYILGMTLAHQRNGGEIWAKAGGNDLIFNDSGSISLADPLHVQLRNHLAKPVRLKRGNNKLTIGTVAGSSGKKVGIDFFWVKKK